MPYRLTLTRAERDAFDWVGDRNAAGEIARILGDCPESPEAGWDDEGPVTFAVSEVSAWRIRDLAEAEDFAWPCFDAELAERLDAFLAAIV